MTSHRIGSASLTRNLGAWHDASEPVPAYRQLADGLRLLILDGRLSLGLMLPGERELAGALGFSRTTITAAYAALRDSGFLESRRGSGARTSLPLGPGARPLSDTPLAPGDVIDFAAASLPAGQAVHQAYAAALDALPAYLPTFGYQGAGLAVLRTALAERYTRRGLPTAPSEIMVTSGALHGFSLLLRLLTRPGDRVLVDHPTYPHALDALHRASCLAAPVALPAEGWDMDGLIGALRQSAPKAAYIIADFHNPTGRCMDAPTRGALARAAVRAGAALIFDETLHDLGLDMAPPSPDADVEAAVIRLGSLSKSFWGGLRIGWIRAEAGLIASLVTIRPSLDLGTPVLEQLAATALVEADAGLAERRTVLSARRDALAELLAHRLPTWRHEIPAGGLSCWVELPRPISTRLAATAERFGLRLAAGPRFGLDGAFERFIRLPYSQPSEVLEQAVNRLAATFNALESSHRPRSAKALDLQPFV
jgi:DNA-binding transcriptional MocR family regulator